jgi:DNA ligase-1
MVRKTKPTAEDLIESEKLVEYWVYDCYLDGSEKFGERWEFIQDTDWPDCVKLVETHKVSDKKHLDILYDLWRKDGYEGQIIRTNSAYENKRSWHLLKRKEVIDKEFKIVSVLEGKGNRSNMAGKIVLRLEDGRTSRAGIKGGETVYKRLWKEQDELIGKLATVEFFSYTPDGKPRFPVCIAIRDYE